MFDVIERLKSEWTDKYVVIDSRAPELARFARATGLVKTVNMNGRCLVEFDQFNNIGWYDIDPAALKIVPKPLPKPAEPKAQAAKPAAAAKPAPAKPAGDKKPSAADILAAARAKGSAAPPQPAAKPVAGGGLSAAEILARARGAKAAPAAPSPPPATDDVAEESAAAPAPAPAVKPAAAKAATGPLPKVPAEIIAWCRSHDAKG